MNIRHFNIRVYAIITDFFQQSLRWVEADEINPDQMTFPIDRKVAGMVRKHLSAG